MRKILLIAFLVQVGVMVGERAYAKENPQLEKTEWSDIWLADANQNDLPRVLMVGDSIAQGYFRDVEKDLTGKAYCAKYATSKFMGNPDYLDELKLILKRYRFNVIHINNGLHGRTYTFDEQICRRQGAMVGCVKPCSMWLATSSVRLNLLPDVCSP